MRTHTDREIRLLVARASVGEAHTPLDLAGANLELANLPHVDLTGANLTGANLRGAMLWGAVLGGACLDGADLSCAQLTWARLSGCRLQGTLFLEADLDEAAIPMNCGQAVMTGADLHTVVFGMPAQQPTEGWGESSPEATAEREAAEAVLFEAFKREASPTLRQRGVSGRSKKYEELEKAKVRVLTDEDLRELLQFSRDTGKPLNLRGCNLAGVDLRGAELSRACLSCADLSGAVLSGAVLNGADLRDAWLADADLSGAQLDGAKLTEAGLPRANLRGASLRGAKLAYADLSGAETEDAHFDDADLSGATGTGRPGDPVPPPPIVAAPAPSGLLGWVSFTRLAVLLVAALLLYAAIRWLR